MKVRISDSRMPRRIGRVGDVVDVPERYAKAWLHRGFAVLPDAEAPKPAGSTRAVVVDYAAMDYNALRSLAAERGIKPKGRKKEDYVAALQAAGQYGRRDMRAEG